MNCDVCGGTIHLDTPIYGTTCAACVYDEDHTIERYRCPVCLYENGHHPTCPENPFEQAHNTEVAKVHARVTELEAELDDYHAAVAKEMTVTEMVLEAERDTALERIDEGEVIRQALIDDLNASQRQIATLEADLHEARNFNMQVIADAVNPVLEDLLKARQDKRAARAWARLWKHTAKKYNALAAEHLWRAISNLAEDVRLAAELEDARNPRSYDDNGESARIAAARTAVSAWTTTSAIRRDTTPDEQDKAR